MLRATVAAPGHAMALPLMPEFIAPKDGDERQDCERNAVKRWPATHAGRMTDLRPISWATTCSLAGRWSMPWGAAGEDLLLTAKPSSHKALCGVMNGAMPEERVLKQKIAGRTLTCRCRWFSRVPLRDGADARVVDWVGATVADAKDEVTYDGVFVTSLDVTGNIVAEIVACAKAR